MRSFKDKVSNIKTVARDFPFIFCAFVLMVIYPGMAFCEVSDEARTLGNNTAIEPLSFANLLQVVIGLFVVIVIIVGMAWLLRKYGKFSSSGNGVLKIIAGLSVGQKEKIVIVSVGDNQILLGVAPGNIQTLHVLDKPVSQQENDSELPESFAEKFKHEINRRMLS